MTTVKSGNSSICITKWSTQSVIGRFFFCLKHFFTFEANRKQCNGTLVTRWTTSCVKGFLPINLLCFTYELPDVTTLKPCKDSIFGNSIWHCLLQNLWFISVKKLANFILVVGLLLPRKFKLISGYFKLVN